MLKNDATYLPIPELVYKRPMREKEAVNYHTTKSTIPNKYNVPILFGVRDIVNNKTIVIEYYIDCYNDFITYISFIILRFCFLHTSYFYIAFTYCGNN